MCKIVFLNQLIVCLAHPTTTAGNCCSAVLVHLCRPIVDGGADKIGLVDLRYLLAGAQARAWSSYAGSSYATHSERTVSILGFHQNNQTRFWSSVRDAFAMLKEQCNHGGFLLYFYAVFFRLCAFRGLCRHASTMRTLTACRRPRPRSRKSRPRPPRRSSSRHRLPLPHLSGRPTL